ncbi:MAG: sugar phosphate isomerase/epimerase [bacterium]
MKTILSISTCWNSHRHVDGLAMLDECASLGFDFVELGHGISYSLWPGILEGVRKGVVRISSLHNFCPLPIGFSSAAPNCYEFSDSNFLRRQKALRLTLETIRHAGELGAAAVVLHLGATGQRRVTPRLTSMLAKGQFGSRGYVRLKIKSVVEHEKQFHKIWPWIRETLEVCAEEARKCGVKLGLECREAIEEIPMDSLWEEIFSALPAHVGYWHDFGHAARKEALGYLDAMALFRRMLPRLAGCHVHDFQYPDRDHQPLGEGIIPFKDYISFFPSGMVCILELSHRIARKKVEKVQIFCTKLFNQNSLRF